MNALACKIAAVPSQPLEPGVASNDAAASTTKVVAERGPSKSATVLKLLRRKRSASLPELQAATGRQAPSLRGFLSGTMRKRLQFALAAELGSDGVRRYRIEGGTAPADTASDGGDVSAPAAPGNVG
ncbi:DUF3489 domain-containing protein [Aureimonas leprariae]|uniref:DUF3489 domain-containing protein n=1 Tax=Plantimonas leprariae TaxID=2615207 RepID=A0A7V7PP00_9HYPH|nr:DUF3489 domain-containing protein [Aureimonas leprariae]KAB0679512.1 DUF3489 domain-containing protein [Aureimonas leprariae]